MQRDDSLSQSGSRRGKRQKGPGRVWVAAGYGSRNWRAKDENYRR